MLHGREAAKSALVAAEAVFEQGKISTDLPVVRFIWDGGEGWTERTIEAILKASGLARSLSDARRKIAAGAVRINDERIKNPKKQFRLNDVDPNMGCFKVQYGKKKIVLENRYSPTASAFRARPAHSQPLQPSLPLPTFPEAPTAGIAARAS